MPTRAVSPSLQVDEHLALADDGVLVLRDLIARRQVGIEIVLAVEHAETRLILRLEAKAGADRLLDAFAVDDRQHAGHRRIDEADLRVGVGAEFGGSAGKQLGLGQDLGMDLQADDDFPLAGRCP